MSLLTYKDVRPWVRSIVSRVTAGTMPPWHADPTTGEFLNDRRLASAEKETLLQWAAAGAPEGDPADLPAPPTYVEGWTIGQPDAILAMQEDYPVPASGKIGYQHSRCPPTFRRTGGSKPLRFVREIARWFITSSSTCARRPRPPGSSPNALVSRGADQRRCSRLPRAWTFRQARPGA